MKIYVIVTADIHPIGGLQLYTAGKSNFLKRNGWCVKVLYCGNRKASCKVEELNQYLDGGFYSLGYPPEQLPAFLFKREMEKMLLFINANSEDEVLVESHADLSAFWGERIAERLHAKHICFNCNEKFRGENKFYEQYMDFFWFKYKREELLGLHDDSLKKLFDGYHDVPSSHDYWFDAVEPGPIQDIESNIVSKIVKYDINIAYLGRITKGYVPHIIKGVVEFANNHPEKQIGLIIIGNEKERLALINSLISSVKNLHITYMGDLVPIPKCIYKKIDCMIAGAICAEISAREGIPTIVADCENYLANGILGYTVNNSMYFEPENGQKRFDEELENVFFTKEYLKNSYHFPDALSSDDIYNSHFKFFLNSKDEKYYEFNHDYFFSKSLYGKVKMIIFLLFPMFVNCYLLKRGKKND